MPRATPSEPRDTRVMHITAIVQPYWGVDSGTRCLTPLLRLPAART
jgi:hypothetical protein